MPTKIKGRNLRMSQDSTVVKDSIISLPTIGYERSSQIALTPAQDKQVMDLFNENQELLTMYEIELCRFQSEFNFLYQARSERRARTLHRD